MLQGMRCVTVVVFLCTGGCAVARLKQDHNDRELTRSYTSYMSTKTSVPSLGGAVTVRGGAIPQACSSMDLTWPDAEVAGSVVASDNDFLRVYQSEKARWAEVIDRLK